MKASTLIGLLKEAIQEHGDLNVDAEGCDCVNRVSAVSAYDAIDWNSSDLHRVKTFLINVDVEN